MAHSIADTEDRVEGGQGSVFGWDIGGVNTKAVRWPDLETRCAPTRSDATAARSMP
jgi:hypothetical protein